MSESARGGFGRDTTTAEVIEGIDLDGKLALVTGGSGGLGAETARALASKGARVVITARDVAKGEKVARGIRASTGNDAIEVEELELGSLASIRAFADRFLALHDAVQILVNNAGVMACPFGKTTDGFELQFGTNHLGHFLMTGLIARPRSCAELPRASSRSARAATRCLPSSSTTSTSSGARTTSGRRTGSPRLPTSSWLSSWSGASARAACTPTPSIPA